MDLDRFALLLTLMAIGCAPPARELRARGSVAYNHKAYAECGRMFDRAAARSRHRDSLASVNAACCWALGGDSTRAFAALDRALDQGYHRPAALEDSDLASLHGDPRWTGVVERVRRNLERFAQAANPLLLRIYKEDQADRRAPPAAIDWKVVRPRDDARQAKVREILDGGGAKVAADFYHAAMIFQHGHTVEELGLAHQLAMRAVALDQDELELRWLAAATEDRHLMVQGKPQRFGTQKVRDKDGRWRLYRYDPGVSDGEREEWGVSSLKELQAEADQLNAPSAH